MRNVFWSEELSPLPPLREWRAGDLAAFVAGLAEELRALWRRPGFVQGPVALEIVHRLEALPADPLPLFHFADFVVVAALERVGYIKRVQVRSLHHVVEQRTGGGKLRVALLEPLAPDPTDAAA